MDAELERKISEKVQETLRAGPELRRTAQMLSEDRSESFVMGMVSGRLYNSFYYQCRRIQKRDPTKKEFEEFLDLLARNRDQLARACREELSGNGSLQD